MLKDIAKFVLAAKAVSDVLKEKVESKVCDLATQVNAFKNNDTDTKGDNEQKKSNSLKGKATEELMSILNEISHKRQIGEVQLKGLVKDKLVEFTNNAILDSRELNDIRSEIAELRAEIADLKSQICTAKT